MRMKKFFTLFFLCLLTATYAMAEDGGKFQFTDKSGNVISNGETVTRNELTEDPILGNFVNSGLMVKNVSGASAAVRISYQIETLDNGTFQICFPESCISKAATGSFETSKGAMTAGEQRDLQCEWFPETYGTCKATLTIEELNALGTKVADGPSITVVFQYANPTRVDALSGVASITEHYTLQGVPVDGCQKGIIISRLADGRIVKTITK